MRRLAPLLALALLGAGPETLTPPDPVLPPEPTPAPTPEPSPDPNAEPTTLDRYQQCFQKMIDTGASDNAFMRRCLGIPDKEPKPPAGSERSHLTRDDVVTVFDEHVDELRGCYGKLLLQTKDLGLTPEGNVVARFSVTPDGNVASVTFESTAISDVNLLSCVREAIKGWRFPKTHEQSKLNVELAVRLKSKAGRKPSAALAKGSPKLSGSGYSLSPADILAVFRKNVGKVRACYDALVKRKPDAAGQAAFDLVVSPRGRPSRVVVREYTVGDEGFRSCLVKQIRTWRFPRPKSGEAVSVSYPPFVFGKTPKP